MTTRRRVGISAKIELYGELRIAVLPPTSGKKKKKKPVILGETSKSKTVRIHWYSWEA